MMGEGVGNRPKVTVGLPTYNRAGYLKECLASILNQSFRDFEVIVSDNCSTDSTAEVALSCTDPRVRYSRNGTNIGHIANMNRCLTLARGQYLVIAHDDDLYAHEFLAREVELLDNSPTVGMVHCATFEIDANAIVTRLVRAHATTCILGGKHEFIRYLQGHNVCCSTVMAPRRVYEEMGGLDTRYMCWDWLMWLRLALRYDIAYIADPLVGMRVHGERVSSCMSAEKWHREFVDIFQEAYAEALAEFPEILEAKERLVRQAEREQSKRFLIAAVQAASLGNFAVSQDYVNVLRGFNGWGLPRLYALVARLLSNRVGQSVLAPVRQARRFLAKRGTPPVTFS